ncbi:DUF1810 family protein [Altererythrobacter soli]|uniref:DUF1810 family protein n=1 Tax=Croceibacterium soli TaxID=1739690 RepID=A0A6I4UYD5_9SPHN|nr:DUF1810 domain-containing protein [Croceibacterium soli]MXP41965.1 DUF1810 family protein [Croceibacterium soli]
MPLDRFIEAQAPAYHRALAELRGGAKQSHWMWFIFPQISGLGRSPTAQFYAIADRAEAHAYLAHPVLGRRLRECTDAMLAWGGRKSAEAILGPIDAQKFRSSMTLFEAVAEDDDRFAQALEAFYAGTRDQATLDRL